MRNTQTNPVEQWSLSQDREVTPEEWVMIQILENDETVNRSKTRMEVLAKVIKKRSEFGLIQKMPMEFCIAIANYICGNR